MPAPFFSQSTLSWWKNKLQVSPVMSEETAYRSYIYNGELFHVTGVIVAQMQYYNLCCKMMRLGTSCSQQTCCTNILARLHAEGSFGHAMKYACFKNMSTTVHIMVVPLLSGNSTIKSMAISSHGVLGLAIGCSNPGVFPGNHFMDVYTRQLVQ